MTPHEKLVDAAQRALEAYQYRFESVPRVGNYVGPIDEEMTALRAALRLVTPPTRGGVEAIKVRVK
jgi:hypothetical protein